MSGGAAFRYLTGVNKERLKKVMDQIDEIAAEAADHPPLNEDESISMMINLGRLEAAKDILKTIYKKAQGRSQ